MTSEFPTPLRRNRDFMLLRVTQVLSTVGTRITSVAYPLLVLAAVAPTFSRGMRKIGDPADSGA